MKLIVMFLLCALLPLGSAAQKPEVSVDSDLLASLLGEMPEKRSLQIDTLESLPLDGGMRYKIRYFIEAGNPVLGTPDDWGSAYVFVPSLPEGEKAPAIVALHLVEQLNAFSEAYLSNGGKDIETLLFEENGGRHCFPPKVKEKAYSWLDRHLKRY